MVTKLKKMETKLKKMETKVFISMTKDELETLIINCVNACLRNDKTKKESGMSPFIERRLPLDILCPSSQINWDDVYEEANHRSQTAFDEYVKSICNDR